MLATSACELGFEPLPGMSSTLRVLACLLARISVIGAAPFWFNKFCRWLFWLIFSVIFEGPLGPVWRYLAISL